jgi:methyltransferase OMS1, mitochondrial
VLPAIGSQHPLLSSRSLVRVTPIRIIIIMLLSVRAPPTAAHAAATATTTTKPRTLVPCRSAALSAASTSAAADATATATAAAAAATAAAAALLPRRAVLLSAGAAYAAAALPTSPQNVDYDPYAAAYDGLDGAAPAEALGLPDLRRDLMSRARGHVLELAVGTGLNLPLYDTAAGGGAAAAAALCGGGNGGGGLFGPSSSSSSSAAASASLPGAPALCSVTGVDLSRGMLAEAARRAEALGSGGQQQEGEQGDGAALGSTRRRPLALVAADGDATARDASAGARDSSVVPLRLVRADAARLPFPDASFDTSLDTFSMCVLPDPERALAELARVTRPGGRVLLLEHAASDFAPLAAYQRATEKAVAATSKGCAWAQDVVGMVERTPGLRVAAVRRHLPGGVIVSVEAERVAAA